MKTVLTIAICLFSFGWANAQAVSAKEANKLFGPKGTHRAPFKKSSEVGLASVNLRFKTATREYTQKRDAGSAVTWAFLEGVDSALFQEIADEYYIRLANKLRENGWNTSDGYQTSKHYQSLVERSADRSRITDSKSWGVAQVYTANNQPYIEYPLMATAAHAKMGNEQDMPVGALLITLDFADIVQKVSAHYPFALPHEIHTKQTSAKTTIVPMIRIEGVTSGQVFGGDGTYAKFVGGNWSFCNAVLANTPIYSQQAYATEVESSKAFPESMKKIKSDVVSDLVSIFSRGAVNSGRAGSEFMFVVQTDREKYRQAALDALDRFNEYLVAYIKANN